jgi:hypothetical protein
VIEDGPFSLTARRLPGRVEVGTHPKRVKNGWVVLLGSLRLLPERIRVLGVDQTEQVKSWPRGLVLSFDDQFLGSYSNYRKFTTGSKVVQQEPAP